MDKPKQYVPGQDQNLDKLVATYEHLGQSPLSERDASVARDPKDPFGFKEVSADPLVGAQEGAKKLVNTWSFLMVEQQLTPEAAVYMLELMALNILNSSNMPLTRPQILAAQTKAREYYQKGIRELNEIERLEAEAEAKRRTR